jgi:hypothetical protein
MADLPEMTDDHGPSDSGVDPGEHTLSEPDGADVPLTEHAPARQATGPEQRGTGGSG